MKVVDIFLNKLKTLDDALYPNDTGERNRGLSTVPIDHYDKPTVGELFYTGNMRTSTVVEILSESKFRTINSVYSWSVSEPRDVNLETYLNGTTN